MKIQIGSGGGVQWWHIRLPNSRIYLEMSNSIWLVSDPNIMNADVLVMLKIMASGVSLHGLK